ncbi:MAG: DUF29 domain-containing protein [Leptolyngbyaceae cyanobacterium SM2_5_2]|nr:DUF29 domain-containing protein [Leptolyngbyaceae cyanobacterium SM2_5_2]
MVNSPLSQSLRQLYEEDLVLWAEATANCLKKRDTQHLDWDSLVEEIEDLSKSAKRELESRLSVLLVHLLKQCYVEPLDGYRGWQLTILEQRNALKRLLKQSPSLKGYLSQSLDDIYEDALTEALAAYPDSLLPTTYPFSRSPEALLSTLFWSEPG